MASSDLEKQIAKLSPAKQALLARKRSESKAAPVLRREPRDRAPLSFAQERFWLIHELDPASYLYNVPRALRLTGKLDHAALERSLNEMVRRHEALRTVFRVESGEPVQIIAPEVRISLTVGEVPERSGMTPLEVATELALEEYRRPFDLSAGPVLRARLWKLTEEDHLLLLVMHHIVSDGWSGGVLFEELGALYQAFSAGQSSPLPELPIQYSDFAVWQRAWLERVLDKEIAFWRNRLAGAPPMLELPTDRPRPSQASFRGHTGSLMLPADLTRRIAAFAKAQG
ncbi:MAG TPA: condensation domain-containing protein, partial [Terriglobales bacterium]|nr:condensation domain-containing protein [Terriglobales bacterium]